MRGLYQETELILENETVPASENEGASRRPQLPSRQQEENVHTNDYSAEKEVNDDSAEKYVNIEDSIENDEHLYLDSNYTIHANDTLESNTLSYNANGNNCNDAVNINSEIATVRQLHFNETEHEQGIDMEKIHL